MHKKDVQASIQYYSYYDFSWRGHWHIPPCQYMEDTEDAEWAEEGRSSLEPISQATKIFQGGNIDMFHGVNIEGKGRQSVVDRINLSSAFSYVTLLVLRFWNM